jgi:hypothetical protein
MRMRRRAFAMEASTPIMSNTISSSLSCTTLTRNFDLKSDRKVPPGGSVSYTCHATWQCERG